MLEDNFFSITKKKTPTPIFLIFNHKNYFIVYVLRHIPLPPPCLKNNT